MNYREVAPAPALAAYVECFWSLQGTHDPAAGAEAILPDGRAELVLNLADPFLRQRPGTLPVRQSAFLLVGQITGPLLLRPAGRIDLLAIRFRTAGLGAFLNGVPAHQLTDSDFAAYDIIGARLRDLADAAAAAPSDDARIAVLEAMLLADLRRAPPVDARAAAAAGIIAASHGTARVDDVAAAVALSPRQLERLFLAHVGMGPKRLARITRFQRMVALLGRPDGLGWARAAVRCGYYDQAHLIRDFREFSGSTPADFMLNGNDALTEAFLRGG